MKNEIEFKEFLLDKMEEICEEVEQSSDGCCPFCCQNSYPVNRDVKGYVDLEEAGLEPEYYHTDHHNDCLIIVLDKYRIQIRKHGLW